METGPENWKNCSFEHLEKSRTHRVGSGGLLDMAGHDESPERTEKFSYVKDFRTFQLVSVLSPIRRFVVVWWVTESSNFNQF